MITRCQLKATTINRRLEAVRRLLRWAEATGAVAANVAAGVRTIRLTGDRQPVGLTAAEVHGLLRAAGESSHGLARRNYALVQLMLQTGLRIGEVAALRRADITLRERAGALRVRHGKGLREREVPLNATARRALRQVFERDPAPARPEDPVFRSTRNEPLPVRSIQNTIAGLVRRAGLTRPASPPTACATPSPWPGCASIRASWSNWPSCSATKASTPPPSTPAPRPRISPGTSNRPRSISMAEPAPEEIDPDRILNDWALDEADLREVMRARGPDSRLWTALHLCGVRRTGRFIDDPAQVPRERPHSSGPPARRASRRPACFSCPPADRQRHPCAGARPPRLRSVFRRRPQPARSRSVRGRRRRVDAWPI